MKKPVTTECEMKQKKTSKKHNEYKSSKGQVACFFL